MIVENKYIDQIEKIWKENNQGYIGYSCNQRSIKDNEMLKVLYVEDEKVLGYSVLYFGKDFCDLERYPNKIESMPDKTIYIWEMVVDKDNCGKGIGTNILKYIKDKFADYTIFCAVEDSNFSSLAMTKKANFEKIYDFTWEDNHIYNMMKYDKNQ